MRGSLKSYRKVSLESQLADASPHKITQMLFNGALERLAQSKAAIEQQNVALKGLMLGKALGIIQGLRSCLVMDAGGEVAKNLSELYDFMQRKIGEANMNNDAQAIDDVMALLRTIKEGWDAIPAEQHNLTYHSQCA